VNTYKALSYGNGRIGERLRRIMAARGVGVRELCRATGISRGAVHTWLDDRCEPRWSAVMAIADALRVPVESFRPDRPDATNLDGPAVSGEASGPIGESPCVGTSAG
jgi:transcriptional regulator with XRE-family HTH domain